MGARMHRQKKEAFDVKTSQTAHLVPYLNFKLVFKCLFSTCNVARTQPSSILQKSM